MVIEARNGTFRLLTISVISDLYSTLKIGVGRVRLVRIRLCNSSRVGLSKADSDLTLKFSSETARKPFQMLQSNSLLCSEWVKASLIYRGMELTREGPAHDCAAWWQAQRTGACMAWVP